MKSRLLRGALDLLFPRRCPVCGELLPVGERYCNCHALEVRTIRPPTCEHCGNETERCICRDEKSQVFAHLAAPYRYTGKVRDDLLALKFQGAREQAAPLGRAMARCFALRFPDAQIDVVTFVPMTRRAKAQRGFNQSERLAKMVGKQLFVPCRSLLQKTVDTPNQHDLSQQERRKNLLGVFASAGEIDVRGQTILLVDDIKTTGATLAECVRVLENSGVADVYCLCCALSDYLTD